jgi:hypothetical protein
MIYRQSLFDTGLPFCKSGISQVIQGQQCRMVAPTLLDGASYSVDVIAAGGGLGWYPPFAEEALGSDGVKAEGGAKRGVVACPYQEERLLSREQLI